MAVSAGRLVVGPFNRVEGDLEVRLDIADGAVREARVCAPMYRGFEQMLPGRAAPDALTIVPRICGICSLSQSVAAARALADLAGVRMPPNGAHAVNLMSAVENLADHVTHFYLFFMPDFARAAYAHRRWHHEAERRFAAGRGDHARRATAARARWFHAMGTLGGRWPMSGSVRPGGSTRALESTEVLQLHALVREFRAFLEEVLFAAPLEEVAALDSAEALVRWQADTPWAGDLRFFLDVADDLGLAHLGRGPGRFLSYGAYPSPEGAFALAAGVWTEGGEGAPAPLALASLTEDVSHAWLGEAGDGPRHPSRGHTEPAPDKPGAYTWNKAPRLDGHVVETGALARQLVAGHPLLRDLVAREGGGVRTRVIARLVELAVVLPWVEGWLAALQARAPFHAVHELPEDGQGVGLAEAARGALGHWLEVRDGRIARYQIVAPTSWNFSPRDAAGTPGALEAALVGTPVAAGEAMPVAVQHVVRSFDPCMVCTVH
ncbi:MAG TPA: nickel-dependent hydrogenase large subunit [Burkholderiaceae bacterium]|nr:nickel-dependent hydrogenase large subunit [Burkholderiaceae bacterium]